MADKQEDNSGASKWRKRYKIAESNQEQLFKRFAEWYDIMYTVLDTAKIAPWRSKVVFPTLGNKVWMMAAKFVNLKPGFIAKAVLPQRDPNLPEEEWKAQIADLKQREEKAQRMLERDYNNPDFDEPMRDKLLAPLIDALVPGTGLAKAPWAVKNTKRYERIEDEYGEVDMTQEKVIEAMKGHNDLIPVNVFNIFIAPASRNLYSAPWIIIKEYKSLDELTATNEANGGKFYNNLDKLKDVKSTSDPHAQYKASRNRLLNETDPVAADETLSQLPIYECYELSTGYICTYAEASGDPKDEEGWVELRKYKNPYWHGKYPLVSFYTRKRPHDFWGLGVFETNQRVNAGKNDLFNHYLDQWNISVDGGIIAEENSIVNDYVIEPGFEITYKGAEPKQFKFPEPNPAQLTTVSEMLERELEEGTISPYAAGSPNSATDKTSGTKGGILALQEAANDTIGFMRANFQQSIRTIGQMWHSNNQQYMSQSETLMASVNGQEEAVEVSPLDLQGKFDIQIDDASMQPQTKEEMRESFMAFTEQSLLLQKASLAQAQVVGSTPIAFDFKAMEEEMAEQFGLKAADKFILSDEEMQELQVKQQEQMMQQQQMQQQQAEQQMMMQQQQAEQHGIQKETASADKEVERMAAELQAQGVL